MSGGFFDEDNKLDGFMRIKWLKDSEEYVRNRFDVLFGKDKRLGRRFKEMVEQFREIVRI